MTVHLVKLCVGAESASDLDQWAKQRAARNAKAKLGAFSDHVTRMRPRCTDEILAGGSLYWVIKGRVLVRQRIVRFDDIDENGVRKCRIMLAPDLIATLPQPRRAFQGWRYLRVEDAPPDLRMADVKAASEIAADLAGLGLL